LNPSGPRHRQLADARWFLTHLRFARSRLLIFGPPRYQPRISRLFFIQPNQPEFSWGRDVLRLANLPVQTNRCVVPGCSRWRVQSPNLFRPCCALMCAAPALIAGGLLVYGATTPRGPHLVARQIGAGVLIGFRLSGVFFQSPGVLSPHFSKLVPPTARDSTGAGTARRLVRSSFLFAPVRRRSGVGDDRQSSAGRRH